MNNKEITEKINHLIEAVEKLTNLYVLLTTRIDILGEKVKLLDLD